jgi:hypothetical protein
MGLGAGWRVGMVGETQREYSEFDERNKVRYVIVYELNPEFENELVKHLVIEKRYLPLWPATESYIKVVWEISYSNLREMRISVYEARENLFGTGSERFIDANVNFYFEKDPWFMKSKELEEHIRGRGVRETIKEILNDLIWYFRNRLIVEDEEVKSIFYDLLEYIRSQSRLEKEEQLNAARDL